MECGRQGAPSACVLADAITRQSDRLGYRGRHRRHIAGRDQAASLRCNEFGYAAAVERDDRGAARHRLGYYQSVWLVPLRSDEGRRRPSDQTGQRVLAQMSGIAGVAAQ